MLSNLYLNEVDRMLEKAIDTTRNGKYTYIQYVRFADDMGILIDSYTRHDWLVKAVERRLREELAKLRVEINEEKSRMVDLRKQGSFGFLGFDFRRIRSLKGVWRPQYTPKLKKRTAVLAKLRDIFRRHASQPVGRVIEMINPILRGWVNCGGAFRQMFHVYQRLGRKEDTETSDACAETPGLRLEAME